VKHHFRFPSLYLLSFILLFTFSCKSYKAVAPEEKYIPFTIYPEISEVNIPVEVSIPGMERSINNMITGLLYEDNDLENNGGDDLMLKVWKQDKITIDVKQNNVFYNIPLKLWIKAGFKIDKFGIKFSQYNEGECALTLKFKSKVGLDSLWRVTTSTEANGYDWITKPTIKIGTFDMPITFLANQILKSQQGRIAGIIDKQAAAHLDIKKYVEEAWNKIQQPLKISQKPEAWLSLKPVQATMTPFDGKTGKISSSIGLQAFAQSAIGPKPVPNLTPLSTLKVMDKTINQFSISLISDISYDFATEMAKNNLVGQTYTFKNGKYKIEVKDLKIYGSGPKLVIDVLVDGSLKGNVYLSGIPKYNAEKSLLTLDQFDYDLSTKNQLLKSADWLSHANFVKKIEPYFQYSLEKDINKSKEMIQKAITQNHISKNVILNGSITDLLPKEVIITPETIKTVVNAKGLLEVKIDGLD
jgi:hypothetical protein